MANKQKILDIVNIGDKKNRNNGFGLLGVMVAIFIISIGLVAILGMISISVRSSDRSEMQLIASGLAQEGIEIVRFIRHNHYNYADWSAWYNSVNDGDYYLQYNSYSLNFCDGGACCPDCSTIPCPNLTQSCPISNLPLKLRIINGVGIYQYQEGGEETSFYRKINLTKVSSDEIRVTVIVSWSSGSFTVEDRLWNWE